MSTFTEDVVRANLSRGAKVRLLRSMTVDAQSLVGYGDTWTVLVAHGMEGTVVNHRMISIATYGDTRVQYAVKLDGWVSMVYLNEDELEFIK